MMRRPKVHIWKTRLASRPQTLFLLLHCIIRHCLHPKVARWIEHDRFCDQHKPLCEMLSDPCWHRSLFTRRLKLFGEVTAHSLSSKTEPMSNLVLKMRRTYAGTQGTPLSSLTRRWLYLSFWAVLLRLSTPAEVLCNGYKLRRFPLRML